MDTSVAITAQLDLKPKRETWEQNEPNFAFHSLAVLSIERESRIHL
jgi:hypothetical protein